MRASFSSVASLLLFLPSIEECPSVDVAGIEQTFRLVRTLPCQEARQLRLINATHNLLTESLDDVDLCRSLGFFHSIILLQDSREQRKVLGIVCLQLFNGAVEFLHI